MAIERLIKETLDHQFLLNFGNHPTHLAKVAFPFIPLGQEHPQEVGCFFSFSFNRYAYGAYRSEPSSDLTIHGTSFPRFHLHGERKDNHATQLPSYASFFTHLWFNAQEMGYKPIGKTVFLDLTSLLNQKMTAILPVAMLLLEVLSLHQSKPLTIEEKASLLSLSIQEGFHKEIRKDWILAFLQGGVSYGDGQSLTASSIVHYPSSLFDTYRFLSFSTQGGHYYLDKMKRQSTFASSINDHFKTTSLLSIDALEFLDSYSVLTAKFGSVAYSDIQHFFSFQHECKHLSIQLERGHIDRWIPLAHAQSKSLLNLVNPTSEDDKAFRLLKHVIQLFPTAVITPLDDWYPSTFICMVDSKDYRMLKEKISEHVYRKDIVDLQLVNRSIFTYIL